MAPRQSPAPGKRSWRESSVAAEAAPYSGSRTPLRAILAVAVAGLLGAFAWLLWQPAKPIPPTHFIAVTTGESDSLSVPIILFEAETLAPLKQLAAGPSGFVYTEAAAGDPSIITLLDGLRIKPNDRVIVYVSAHGVSDGGEAFVLASDYDLRRPTAARYSASALINKLASLAAGPKLLIFDCSRLSAAPRMGMAVNEFVSIVEDAARATGDPNLWLMTAGAELQTSPLGLLDRRAALGGAVVDVIVGSDSANDGKSNRKVSLEEFFSDVTRRCASSGVATPAPQLIYCGGDADEKRSEQILIWHSAPPVAKSAAAKVADAGNKAKAKAPVQQLPKLSPVAAVRGADQAQPAVQSGTKPAAAATPAAAPATPATAGGTPPAADVAASPPPSGGDAPAATAVAAEPDGSKVAAQAAGPAQPGGASAQGEATPADKTPPPPAIVAAWRLADELQTPSASGNVKATPIEYAPHLWSELIATLASRHLEHLGQRAGESGDVADIAAYRDGLDRLLTGRSGVDPQRLVTDRLSEALQDYQSSDERRQLAALPAEYSQALQCLRERLFRAVQYIEWHAASPSRETGRRIEDLLQRLEAMDRQLVKVESSPDGSSVGGAGLRQLGIAHQNVRKAMDQLELRVATETATISQQTSPGLERSREALLQTGVPTAKERETLAAASPRLKVERQSGAGDAADWAAALEHLRLEVMLVQFVDPAARSSPALNAALAPPADEEARRTMVRKAGKELCAFYASLPEKIRDYRRAGATREQARAAEKMIAVLHPRDASGEVDELGAAVGFLTPRLRPAAKLDLIAPALATLGVETWQPLRWTVESANVEIAKAEVVIEAFDSDAVDLRFAGEQELIKPGASRALPAGAAGVQLEARARGERDGPRQLRTRVVTLKVKAVTDAGVRELPSEAQVVLPRPNRLELSAYSVTPRRPQDGTGDGVLLQPYPNRQTDFEFELANFTDAKKTVSVTFIALPAASETRLANDESLPTGRVFDVQRRVLPRLETWARELWQNGPVIASVDSLELPPDETAIRLALKAPATKAPAEAAQPDAAGPAPPSEPAPAPDLTRGMLCRIVNLERPEEVWLKWIEIVPLRPTSYLDLTADYDVATRYLSFAARASETDDGAPGELPPGEPVKLVVRGDGESIPAGQIVEQAINAVSRQALLRALVSDRAPAQATIALEIDGVPRAAAWNIDFADGTVKLVDRTSVELERIGMRGNDAIAARLYYTPRASLDPPIDPKQWPAAFELDRDDVCAFDISRGARKLELQLRIDAPRDAFNRVGGGNAVSIGWEGDDQPSLRLFDDRDVHSELDKVTDAGQLSVKSTVSDFTVGLDPAAVNTDDLWLSARLAVRGAADEEVDRLRVVFDGEPPIIRSAAVYPSNEIEVGTPTIGVTLNVQDFSGIGRVDAWILEKQPRTAADLDEKLATPLTLPPSGPFRGDAESVRPLDLSMLAPQEPKQYFLALKVTDRSGQSATTLDQPISFSVVVPKPPPPAGPLVLDLHGRIMLGSKWPDKPLKVFAKELPGKYSTTSGPDGRFIIKQVKEGKYTLIVEGTVINRPVTGEHEIELAEAADYEGVVIPAKLELQEPQKE